MKLASMLRAVFALYMAMLAAVLVYHVRGARRAVQGGHALTALATRQRVVSNDQLGRVTEMRVSAEKFLVTGDRGYFERLFQLAGAYGEELRHLESLALTAEERARIAPLAEQWTSVEERLWQLADSVGAPPAAAVVTVSQVRASLDDIDAGTRQLADAAQDAMARELAGDERAARATERASWVVAASGLVLGILLLVLLIRSIVRPLARLAQGTREISAGRFGHRLHAAGRDEFADVSRDFNTMAERLEELDRLKRDFVSTVSHDLKTPLSSMQETVAVLLDELPGPLTDKQRHLLALNQESGRRLASMLAKLLDLSRIESAAGANVELVDLAWLVRGIVDRVNAARPAGGPHVLLHEPDRGRRVLVRADTGALAQVVENLLENAIKFSPPEGTVQVAVADLQTRDVVLLSVADGGPGVPEADKERVFERFYQTAAGRAVRSRGVGLGLAICRHIVEAHGGRIWVADHEPRGAVFCVVLPALVGIGANGANGALVEPQLEAASA